MSSNEINSSLQTVSQKLKIDSLDLIKPPGISGDKVYTAIDVELEKLLIGGVEGDKFILTIPDPRRKDEADTRKLTFFVKHFKYEDIDHLEYIAQTYRTLYSRGYPVPATTRFFQHHRDSYLAMTDMTEGGKYLLWGYNDRPSPDELNNLRKMNLNADELKQIESKVLGLAEKAKQDGYFIEHYLYHIRRNTETNELDVVLLDVDPSTVADKDNAERYNEVRAITFSQNLEQILNPK